MHERHFGALIEKWYGPLSLFAEVPASFFEFIDKHVTNLSNSLSIRSVLHVQVTDKLPARLHFFFKGPAENGIVMTTPHFRLETAHNLFDVLKKSIFIFSLIQKASVLTVRDSSDHN